MSGMTCKTFTTGCARRIALAATTMLLGMIAACLSTAVTPATAESLFYTATPTSRFGSQGTGTGQFAYPSSIAVNDATGDVYVLESARVQEFDAEGNYLSQFNGSETPGKSLEHVTQMAIDNSSSPSKGDIYIIVGEERAGELFSVIDVFDQNGKYLRQIVGTPSVPFSNSSFPVNVAVDSLGNLWVLELEHNLDEFNSEGEYRAQFPNNIGLGALDIESGNYINYAGNYVGGASKYDLEGKVLRILDEGNYEEPPASAVGMAVNEKNHHVFVGLEDGVYEYGAYGAGAEKHNIFGKPSIVPMETFGQGEPEEPGISESVAIAFNEKTETVYTLQRGQRGPENTNVAIFKPQGFLVPTLGEPLPASGITRTTATLAGTLNPMHSPTTYQFAYGTTSSYGALTQPLDAGKGGKEKTVEQDVKGLAPGTTYHYALVATSPAGSVTGPDQTFTTSPATPPTVTTGGASNVTLTTATLSALIDPEGLETSYVLELGTDSTYGTSISGLVGSNSETVTVDIPVIELAPSTTYHYRFVAVNPDGRIYGQDATFTTPVYEHPIVLPSSEPLLGAPSVAFPAIDEKAGVPRHKRKAAHKKKRSHKHHKRKKKK